MSAGGARPGSDGRSARTPRARSGARRGLGRACLWIAFTLSGCAGLAYEVIWSRMLARAFGATAPATATVLAVFMGGLGAGAWWLGRRADRLGARGCLGRYVGLELGIALFGLASPVLFGLVGDVYVEVAAAVPAGNPARTALRAAIALVALAPATFLMGATLPLVVRAERSTWSTPARAFGALYAVNTLGAAGGALAAALLLGPLLGEAATTRVAAAANLGAALLALGSRALLPARGTDPVEPSASAGTPGLPPPAVLAAALATGFAMLGYQIVWTRTLVMTLGATVHAFAVVLSIVLVGIVVGTVPAARWGDRLARPGRVAGALVVASSLSALGLLALAPRMAELAIALSVRGTPATVALLTTPLVVATPVILLPAALSAAALPLAVRAGARVGASAGLAYAANTLGAVGGALLTGLLAVPLVGSQQSAWLLAAVGAGGGLSAWLAGTRGRERLATVGVVGAVAVTLGALASPTDLRVFAGGMHMMSRGGRALVAREGLETRLAGGELLLAREGAETTIIVERRGGIRTFFVGGKPEASDLPLDLRNQMMLGHVPAMLHGHPSRALVVGLGSGMTAGALTLHARVDVAELSPAVRDAARLFADRNHGVVDNPRARVLLEDGRTVLAGCRARYDVVSVDPIHPYVSGAATLYTRDYFRSVAACLRAGGVAAHWLPLYQLSWLDVAGVVRGFQDVFPDGTVYLTGGDAILIGGAGHTLPVAARFARGYARRAVADDLRSAWLETPERLAATACRGSRGLRRWTAWAPAITDDLEWISVTAPLSSQSAALPALEKLLRACERRPDRATAAELVARRSFLALQRAHLSQAVHGRVDGATAALLRASLAADPTSVELRGAVSRLAPGG